MPLAASIEWVVLTMGDRNDLLARALDSLERHPITLVLNGESSSPPSVGAGVAVVRLSENAGIPGGRHVGLVAGSAPIVGFLDDDAIAGEQIAERIVAEFESDPRLGAVALRLVDEDGDTARRHVPRLAGRGVAESGEVALFLGGACAIRREAYERVGGYFGELFYGHEEVELSWRLVDAGWSIRYLADAEVFHPRTFIERHPEGWQLTGRNRVMIARRTLPWLVAVPHVVTWLMLGLRRAPRGCRRRYVRGWLSGWAESIDRSPISWRGVLRLTRLGRPPLV